MDFLLLLVAVAVIAVCWYLFSSTHKMRDASVNLAPIPSQQQQQQQQQQRAAAAEDAETLPTVLYATHTGTARSFARMLAKEAAALGLDLKGRVHDVAEYDVDSLATESVVVFVVATYEGGKPPESAAAFYNWLEDSANDFRVSKDSFSSLRFAVFGCGDAVYGENFCAVAKKTQALLQKLGARRIFRTGLGDQQYSEEQFLAWMERLWTSLFAQIGRKDLIRKLKAKRAAAAKEALQNEDDAAAEEDDDEYDEEGEPLLDMEDMGNSMAKAQNGNNNNEEEEEEDDDEDDASSAQAAAPKKMLTPSLSKSLTKQGYKLIGSHSGVKLCRWTKAMLRGRGGCYKHTFYNITSYQCMEMTPSLACANKCVFCWRHHKNPVGKGWKWEMDEPEFLIEQSITKHQGMIKQLRGMPGVVPQRFEEAFTVRHCALSLVGEPIIYPKINRFLDLLHDKDISSFLVTNAQFPDAIKNLTPVTQLYLSVDAATPESLKQIDRPVFKDFWERFLASIDALREKGQRTVFRLTLVKQWNMDEMTGYADLIKRGMPGFIEVKGVTYCGNSKASSLTIKNTPYHEEVRAFVLRLVEVVNEVLGEEVYELACEHEHSLCFLVADKKRYYKDGQWHTWINYEKFHQLLRSGKPFSALEYMAPTAPWAVYGAPEQGFDPKETRFRRNKKKGAGGGAANDNNGDVAQYAGQGC